jgi:hypothetical protein
VEHVVRAVLTEIRAAEPSSAAIRQEPAREPDTQPS